MSEYYVYPHKQGDSLDLSGVALTDENEDFDMTGWSGRSQLRDAQGDLIEELIFTWIDAAQGLCRVQSASDTSAWPVGSASFDIQFTTDEGRQISTPTLTVLISGDNTQ